MDHNILLERNTHIKKKLFLNISLLILFIFAVNALAVFLFSWYWTIWWFDMLMHFLGGLWVSLFALWMYFFVFTNKISSLSTFLKKHVGVVSFALLSVLIIGFSWELFEVGVDNAIEFSNVRSLLDSASDLAWDAAGGMLGALYFLRKKDAILNSEI